MCHLACAAKHLRQCSESMVWLCWQSLGHKWCTTTPIQLFWLDMSACFLSVAGEVVIWFSSVMWLILSCGSYFGVCSSYHLP